MVLFRNRSFADIIKLRSHWIRMGLKINNCCPNKKMETWTQIYGKEGNLEMGTVGMMRAKVYQGLKLLT